MADLLAVVKKNSDPLERTLAFRGYISLISLPANRAASDTVKLLAEALDLATRPDEKKTVLAALPKYPCEQALNLAEKAKSDKDIAAEAELAADRIKQITASKTLKVTASHNNSKAANAIDGRNSTRWDTGTPQVGGEWFIIDLGVENTVKSFTLDTSGSAGDYPRGYEVYVSFDGGSWGKPVLSGEGTKPVTQIEFPRPVRTRFIKILQTGSVNGLFWSIHELKVDFE
ncbi:MAG: discoidin domain-containing protein [Sedimentisphaerales bacterium]|nr:discoidin domain-containing protein [Sedimentisphaerales bacterium]